MIISFAWTTRALLAGEKTVTRRRWTPSHARKFRAGQLVDAWDKLPRVRGSKKVATIRLTRDPFLERTSKMTVASYHREGLPWLHEHGVDIPEALWFEHWRNADEEVYVVEFELMDVGA